MVVEVRFKVGDEVKMAEPYRSRRLSHSPLDPTANADWVVVRRVWPGCIEVIGSSKVWLEHAFEHVGGPW